MQLQKEDLTYIYERAATLQELGGTQLLTGNIPEEISPHLRIQWEMALSRHRPTTLKERFAWFQFDQEEIRKAVDNHRVSLRGATGWIGTFEAIMKQTTQRPHSLSKPERDFPFYELLAPFVRFASDNLELPANCQIFIANKVFRDTKEQLWTEISDLASLCFYEEFKKHRTSAPGEEAYGSFVAKMLAGGLIPFYKIYSSLARLLVLLTNNWIYGFNLFLQRLSKDLPDLSTTFAVKSGLGNLIKIKSGLSLPHSKNGPVLKLYFSSGTRIVYKPKPPGTDLAFNHLISWINGTNKLVSHKCAGILPHDNYAWHEFIPFKSCRSFEEVKNYYLRAGHLVALFQALGSTDYHLENLVSNGPYPVAIDHECLFAPLLNDGPEKNSPGFVRSFLLLGFSQLQTPDSPFPSGLFGRSYLLRKTRIRNINKPNMKVVNTFIIRSGKNIPYVNGNKVDPFNYLPEIKAGYLQMANLIRKEYKTFQSVVKASTNDLSISTRFVLRETSWYFDLQEQLKSPSYLESGIARSIKLDQLALRHLCKPATVERAALLRDEINFMESHFIPAFFLPMNEPGYVKNALPANHDTVFAQSARAFYEASLSKFLSSEYPLRQIDLMDKLLQQQMKSDLGKIIGQILTSIPAKTIQKDNLTALQKITSELPAPGLFCLECYLSNDKPRVDLLICIANKDLEIFKTYTGLISQKSREGDINGWRRIDYILNQWSNKDSLLPHIVRNIWITFDLEKDGNQFPEPWAYCLFQDRKSVVKLEGIWAQSVINILWGQQLGHVLEWLENTLDHLPQGISLFGLGIVRRYNSSRSRIILGGFELSAIVPFLKNLDWKGDLSEIARITPCLGRGSWFSIILDYTQKMEPDLGIECWFDPEGSETIIWETLNSLRSLGIPIVDDPGLGLNSKLDYWGYRYWINHIKIKFTSKKKAEVKIYAFFMKED